MENTLDRTRTYVRRRDVPVVEAQVYSRVFHLFTASKHVAENYRR